MSKDEISVPRELLERVTEFTGGFHPMEPARSQLRALLAQPNTCTKDCGQCGLGGYCEPCHSVEPVAWANDQQLLLCSKSKLDVCHPNPLYHQLPRQIAGSALATDYCNTPLYRHPPAQAQQPSTHAPNCPNCPPPGATHTISGQFYRKAEGTWLVFGHKRDWVPSDAPAGWNDENLVPLFPVAQAPVVMPKRRVEDHFHSVMADRAKGWNEYDDEFKRLNPGITEAD